MSGYTRKGITYTSEDKANLAAAIPGAYLNSLDAGYVAEAILDSDWLAEHDRQVAEKIAADIAARVRQNCTLGWDVMKAGGDPIIYAVADWIESPPEWVEASWRNS